MQPAQQPDSPAISTPDQREVLLTDMAQGGAAVGRWQGQVVFAMGGLPGERVRVAVEQTRAAFLRGTVTEVLEPSPERCPPRLPAADHIPWQHIAYPAQLRFKQAILAEQLAKLTGIAAPPVAPVLPAAHPWHYRNTARLHLQQQGGALQPGYYAAGSHQIRPLAADPLLLPALNEALAGLRATCELALERGIPLPQHASVLLRGSAAAGYAVAALPATDTDRPAPPPDVQAALPWFSRQWRLLTPALAGVADRSTQSAPPVTLHEELGGITFLLSVASFFQTHTAQAEVLLAVVRALLRLRPDERLLDAYCGVGTFALPLAAQVREVLAIEAHPQAVQDGQQTAAAHGIGNVRFQTAAVEHALPALAARPNQPPLFAAAILDPPRRGCHPQALQALLRLAPARIAYVSCHPGILARDLRVLLAGGYTLAQVQPVDMFPQTPHIEAVALLVRGEEVLQYNDRST